ncbi:MAG: aminoglycoside phosphotransferase family protein [Chloroflexi bacterium]|nr:aminoglycoside phosphotransferase family protein [Chloroflexota bacterium]
MPKLPLDRARLIQGVGQFNQVLCLDERWILRFPKSAAAAVGLTRELALLPRLDGRLPLPIPKPRFSACDPKSGQLLFMGYAMLPGAPLLRDRFDSLRGDTQIVEQIAIDLAGFLRDLHAIPPGDLALPSVVESPREEWARFYAAIRAQLFPFMRCDARSATGRSFDKALADKSLWRGEPCVVHGDFGTGNILFHVGLISGIIDWGFCGLGDPAQDLGALLASYGEAFVARVCRHFPALGKGLARARFYRRHYALLQALFALRDGDQAEFDDGIAAYR